MKQPIHQDQVSKVQLHLQQDHFMEEAGAEPARAGAGVWEKWTAASVIQLGTGIYSYRKVRSGECRLMPLKAFGIASLFVGAGFTSVFAVVAANGIHSVNDFMEVGANIRSSLGARPRAQDERS